MVISCGALDEAQVSETCRAKGIYLHHIEQWKNEFLGSSSNQDKVAERAETRQLKVENQELKKELHREDKALAETAALLVLKKKSTRYGETTRATHHE